MTNITNITSVNGTQEIDNNERDMVYVSIFLIWLPGIILNTIALWFIIRDLHKTKFPATILLLTLCCYDLLSLMFSLTQHVTGRFVKITNMFCATVSFLFSYFKVSSGVINSFMAIDRVTAICAPFYYRRHFSVKTWQIGCFVAGVATAIYSTFPLIGLGDIWVQRGPRKICALGYQSDPVKRVYVTMYGILGIIFEGTVIVCNIILIKALLKMKNIIIANVQSVTDSSETSDQTNRKQVSPFEVAFAKLMLCLSIAYLICGTPSKVLIILEQIDVPFHQGFLWVSRNLSGYLQVINPMIYILVRKTDRKKIVSFCCKCIKRRNGQLDQ